MEGSTATPWLRPLGEGQFMERIELRQKTSVGRGEANDVVVWPRSVSGSHAVIELLADGGAIVHDKGVDGTGSRFGTFVGEEHFVGGWRELRHGDILRLGTVQHGVAFRYEEDEDAPLPPLVGVKDSNVTRAPKKETRHTDAGVVHPLDSPRTRQRRGTACRSPPVSKSRFVLKKRRDEHNMTRPNDRETLVSVAYPTAAVVRTNDATGTPHIKTTKIPLKDHEQKVGCCGQNAREHHHRDQHNEEVPPYAALWWPQSIKIGEREKPVWIDHSPDTDDDTRPLPEPLSLTPLLSWLQRKKAAPPLPVEDKAKVKKARTEAADRACRLNQMLAGVREMADLALEEIIDVRVEGEAEAAAQKHFVEEVRDIADSLRADINDLRGKTRDDSVGVLRALQGQFGDDPPKVDELIIGEQLKALYDDICRRLHDNGRGGSSAGNSTAEVDNGAHIQARAKAAAPEGETTALQQIESRTPSDHFTNRVNIKDFTCVAAAMDDELRSDRDARMRSEVRNDLRSGKLQLLGIVRSQQRAPMTHHERSRNANIVNFVSDKLQSLADERKEPFPTHHRMRILGGVETARMQLNTLRSAVGAFDHRPAGIDHLSLKRVAAKLQSAAQDRREKGQDDDDDDGGGGDDADKRRKSSESRKIVAVFAALQEHAASLVGEVAALRGENMQRRPLYETWKTDLNERRSEVRGPPPTSPQPPCFDRSLVEAPVPQNPPEDTEDTAPYLSEMSTTPYSWTPRDDEEIRCLPVDVQELRGESLKAHMTMTHNIDGRAQDVAFRRGLATLWTNLEASHEEAIERNATVLRALHLDSSLHDEAMTLKIIETARDILHRDHEAFLTGHVILFDRLKSHELNPHLDLQIFHDEINKTRDAATDRQATPRRRVDEIENVGFQRYTVPYGGASTLPSQPATAADDEPVSLKNNDNIDASTASLQQTVSAIQRDLVEFQIVRHDNSRRVGVLQSIHEELVAYASHLRAAYTLKNTHFDDDNNSPYYTYAEKRADLQRQIRSQAHSSVAESRCHFGEQLESLRNMAERNSKLQDDINQLRKDTFDVRTPHSNDKGPVDIDTSSLAFGEEDVAAPVASALTSWSEDAVPGTRQNSHDLVLHLATRVWSMWAHMTSLTDKDIRQRAYSGIRALVKQIAGCTPGERYEMRKSLEELLAGFTAALHAEIDRGPATVSELKVLYSHVATLRYGEDNPRVPMTIEEDNDERFEPGHTSPEFRAVLAKTTPAGRRRWRPGTWYRGEQDSREPHRESHRRRERNHDVDEVKDNDKDASCGRPSRRRRGRTPPKFQDMASRSLEKQLDEHMHAIIEAVEAPQNESNADIYRLRAQFPAIYDRLRAKSQTKHNRHADLEAHVLKHVESLKEEICELPDSSASKAVSDELDSLNDRFAKLHATQHKKQYDHHQHHQEQSQQRPRESDAEQNLAILRTEDSLKLHLDSVSSVLERSRNGDDLETARDEFREFRTQVDTLLTSRGWREVGESVVGAMDKKVKQHTSAMSKEMRDIGDIATSRAAASEEMSVLPQKVVASKNWMSCVFADAYSSSSAMCAHQSHLQQHAAADHNVFEHDESRSDYDVCISDALGSLHSHVIDMHEQNVRLVEKRSIATTTAKNQLHSLKTQLQEHNMSSRDAGSREDVRTLQTQMQELSDRYLTVKFQLQQQQQQSYGSVLPNARRILGQIEHHSKTHKDEITQHNRAVREKAGGKLCALTDGGTFELYHTRRSAHDTSPSSTVTEELPAKGAAAVPQPLLLLGRPLDQGAQGKTRLPLRQIEEFRAARKVTDVCKGKLRNSLDDTARFAAHDELRLLSQQVAGIQTKVSITPPNESTKFLEKHSVTLQDVLCNTTTGTQYRREDDRDDFSMYLEVKLNRMVCAMRDDASCGTAILDELATIREEIMFLVSRSPCGPDATAALNTPRTTLASQMCRNMETLCMEIRLLCDAVRDVARDVSRNGARLLDETLADLAGYKKSNAKVSTKNRKDDCATRELTTVVKEQLHAVLDHATELEIMYELDTADAPSEAQETARRELVELMRHREGDAKATAAVDRVTIASYSRTQTADGAALKPLLLQSQTDQPTTCEALQPASLEAIQRDVAKLLRRNRHYGGDLLREVCAHEADVLSSLQSVRSGLAVSRRTKVNSEFLRDLRELRKSQERISATPPPIQEVQQLSVLNKFGCFNVAECGSQAETASNHAEDALSERANFEGVPPQSPSLGTGSELNGDMVNDRTLSRDDTVKTASLQAVWNDVGLFRERHERGANVEEHDDRGTLRKQTQRTARGTGGDLDQVLRIMQQQLIILSAVVGDHSTSYLDHDQKGRREDDDVRIEAEDVVEAGDCRGAPAMGTLLCLREELSVMSRAAFVEDAKVKEREMTALLRDIDERSCRCNDNIALVVTTSRNDIQLLLRTLLELKNRLSELERTQLDRAENELDGRQRCGRKGNDVAPPLKVAVQQASDAEVETSIRQKVWERDAAQLVLEALEFRNGDTCHFVATQAKKVAALRTQMVRVDAARQSVIDALTNTGRSSWGWIDNMTKRVLEQFATSMNAQRANTGRAASQWQRRAQQAERPRGELERELDVANTATRRIVAEARIQEHEPTTALKERDERLTVVQKRLAELSISHEPSVRRKQAIVVLQDALARSQEEDAKRIRRLQHRDAIYRAHGETQTTNSVISPKSELRAQAPVSLPSKRERLTNQTQNRN